ncbi:uncharacterized protein TNCV_3777121 [Trichonephila clavipes]|nr:uncharacterized protein TNCV_3777121 [Trichonephila clavipes]
MLCDAREFADEIDIPANFELTQPRYRVRRRNVNSDYEARDDPIEDPILKYKAEFYFFTLERERESKLLMHLNQDNMFTKYQMVKFIDFCEVRFLPESVARVAAIVGDHRCHAPRH